MPNWLWNRKPQNDEAQGVSPEGNVPFTPEDLEIEKKWLQLTRVDPEKFEFFYRKYYNTILIFISGEIKDPEVAQELTNEVFSLAIDRLDTFQWQGYSFGAWLFQIARNVRFEEKRKNRQSPEVPWQDDQDDVEDPVQPQVDLHESEDTELLFLCIRNLDSVRRQVFQAHYWSRMKVREIAIVLGLSESNVKNHMLRGKVQLLRCLLEHGLERGLSAEKMQLIRESTVREEGWSLLESEDHESS